MAGRRQGDITAVTRRHHIRGGGISREAEYRAGSLFEIQPGARSNAINASWVHDQSHRPDLGSRRSHPVRKFFELHPREGGM